MLVLIGCETSGAVREAFRRRGHEAWSCDLLPADDGSPHHIVGDVRDVIASRRWDLGVFHPPCTRLANSGVRWLDERGLWPELEDAAQLFLDVLQAPIPKKAIENPIPHKYALGLIGRKYDQIVQPWMFGHGETKATCLWLEGLPKLTPANVVDGREARIHRLPPSADRWKLRSKTYGGIAEAMAAQWG